MVDREFCKAEISDFEEVEMYDPAPTLFIQDELHLIRESLGTYASHYESFIDYFVKNVEGSDTLKLKYEIAKILKRNKLTGATYLSIEDIVNSDNFYEFCECAVESKRRKSLVKKAKYHHWQ